MNKTRTKPIRGVSNILRVTRLLKSILIENVCNEYKIRLYIARAKNNILIIIELLWITAVQNKQQHRIKAVECTTASFPMGIYLEAPTMYLTKLCLGRLKFHLLD